MLWTYMKQNICIYSIIVNIASVSGLSVYDKTEL